MGTFTAAQDLISILAFIIVGLVWSLTIHTAMKRYFLAAIISAIVSAACFIAVETINHGHFFDTFWWLKTPGIILFFYMYSLLVGLPIYLVRKQKKN